MYRITASANNVDWTRRAGLFGASVAPVHAVAPLDALMPAVAQLPVPMESACGTSCAPVCYEGEWLPAGCADTGYAQHGQPSAIQHYQQMLALARTGGRRWTPSIDERV
nr:hypothetical protein [Plesiomonas shigelloides]